MDRWLLRPAEAAEAIRHRPQQGVRVARVWRPAVDSGRGVHSRAVTARHAWIERQLAARAEEIQ